MLTFGVNTASFSGSRHPGQMRKLHSHSGLVLPITSTVYPISIYSISDGVVFEPS